jgi:hypothetical protein
MDLLRKVWLEDNEIAITKEQRFCLDIFGNSWFLIFGKFHRKKTNCQDLILTNLGSLSFFSYFGCFAK